MTEEPEQCLVRIVSCIKDYTEHEKKESLPLKNCLASERRSLESHFGKQRRDILKLRGEIYEKKPCKR